MPYPRLIVNPAPPATVEVGARADVALFVGFTPRRGSDVPDALLAWLEAAGWAGDGAFARSEAAVEALLDVPVPIDNWSDFDALFAWDQRLQEAGQPDTVPCPLGLAVRSFFAEGGAKAYIVRVGDPPPLVDRRAAAAVLADKRKLISWDPGKPVSQPADVANRAPLLSGFGQLGLAASAGDAATWRGMAHVLGLDDVALVALPDLPELYSGPPQPLPPPGEPPAVAEQFIPCGPTTPGAAPVQRPDALNMTAPRLDRAGYAGWASAIRYALGLMSPPGGAGSRRDVMLVASLPLPSLADGAAPARAEAWPLSILDEDGLPAPDASLLDVEWVGSARLQLAYPWVETAAAAAMPEGVEGAEGVLLGAIARTSLRYGAFWSVAGQGLPSVRRALPELGSGDLQRGLPPPRADWLGDRLCLVGSKLGQAVLLSDATVSADVQWRAGGVSRLMNQILRSARDLGGELFFEPAGARLWSQMQRRLQDFMNQLWNAGALYGATAADAYTVRCDSSSMTQADVDAGRVIATVAFTASQPIQQITVTLALTQAGVGPSQEAA